MWSIHEPYGFSLNFWTVGRLPSSVVLDDDENRGDDVEAYGPPRTQSRGYQPLSTDLVSTIFAPKVMTRVKIYS